jgi:type IV secretory pathway TraG/TraD family ATPase VirD4
VLSAAQRHTHFLDSPRMAALLSHSDFSFEALLNEGITDPDRTVAKRVFEAMMTMKKIDVAKIETARRDVG